MYKIETDHTFQVDMESGQINGVSVHSRLQPKGETKGTWTFELFFRQGENPSTARSDDGKAVLPLVSPQKTPVDQPESQYYVNTRFKGRVDGQPIELEETHAFSIPDIRLGATRDGKDQKTHINTTGGDIIVVADTDRKVLFYRENTQRFSVDLKPGEYLVSVIVRGKVSIMETRKLQVPERGDSDTYPVKGETDRYLPPKTAQQYIDQIKRDKQLPIPDGSDSVFSSPMGYGGGMAGVLLILLFLGVWWRRKRSDFPS